MLNLRDLINLFSNKESVPVANPLKDIKVKIGKVEVTLGELAAPHEPISFDGVHLVSQRANNTLDVSTVFDQNLVDSRSMTQQQFKDETDINKMMDKYVNNRLQLMDVTEPIYGDFVSAEDFLSTQRRIANFKSLFDMLPARTRERFDNDPSKAIIFGMDEANEAEAIDLGILPKPDASVPVPPVVVPEAPAAPAPGAAPVA